MVAGKGHKGHNFWSPNHISLPRNTFLFPEHLSLPRNTFLFPETLFCYSNLSKFFFTQKKGIQQDSNPQPSAQQEMMLTTAPGGLDEMCLKKSPSEFKRDRERDRERVCVYDCRPRAYSLTESVRWPRVWMRVFAGRESVRWPGECSLAVRVFAGRERDCGPRVFAGQERDRRLAWLRCWLVHHKIYYNSVMWNLFSTFLKWSSFIIP